jgi:hypothetical protein
MNKLSAYINIMHYFNSLCCMPHIILFLYLLSVVSIKEILLFREDEMLRDHSIIFLLPSYVLLKLEL